MFEIILLIYTAWAFYSGYKFMTGRSEWLDEKKVHNVICKIIASVLVGYVIGAVNLVMLLLKVIFR